MHIYIYICISVGRKEGGFCVVKNHSGGIVYTLLGDLNLQSIHLNATFADGLWVQHNFGEQVIAVRS